MTCSHRHPWWEPLLLLATLAIAAPILLVWSLRR
jgi:hypothetical protein